MSEAYRRASRVDLVGEIRALTDGVQELYILLQHIWNNRAEIESVVFLADHRPEPVACLECGTIVPTLAEAVERNWRELSRADVGGCKYAGCCPDCPRDEDDGPMPVGATIRVDAEAFAKAMESVPVIDEGPEVADEANHGQATDQGTLF